MTRRGAASRRDESEHRHRTARADGRATTRGPAAPGIRSAADDGAFVERELAELAALPRVPGIDAWLAAFSAKEAVFKVWFPLTGRMLAHHDIAVRLDPAAGTSAARLTGPAGEPVPTGLVDRIEGRFRWDAGHVFSVAWLPAAANRR